MQWARRRVSEIDCDATFVMSFPKIGRAVAPVKGVDRTGQHHRVSAPRE